ncbi:MAG: S41 family peptidase [Dysgonomonas sp.]
MEFKKNKLFFVIAGIFAFTGSLSAQFGMSDGVRKVATAMTIIEKMYVDDIDDNKFSDDAITSLLEKLDPHSTYIKADELKEMNEPLEGNFDGIGISFNMVTDTLYVIETISGGPSERVGILPGDRIIQVDDTIIAGVKMSTKDIMKRLRGPKGTTVNVKVKRRGIAELIEFKIKRDKIPIYSVDAAYMVDTSTGYIKINRFGATTHNEFMDAFKKLKQQNLHNLIVDLQGNGGGYLNAATDIANELLGKGKLLVYTEGRNQPRFSEISKSNGIFENGRLVILVNEGSASASEIVSGAIQDWDRGVIVGRRTFGKGLVQRQFPLPDGGAIRLTVSRYYTPTGRGIQKPYEKGDREDYDKDLINRYNHGEMMSADSIHFPDSLKYQTMINKRTVYGGGGIMPDYFVPLDTLTKYHVQLLAKGIIHKAYLQEVDNSRKTLLEKYPTVDSFKKDYVVSENLINKVLDMAKEEKVEFNEEQYNISKPMILLQIKALIAQNIYHTEDYYKIMNDENPIFLKGLEIINDDKQYDSLLNNIKQ